jgi:hypothetical protein
MMKKYIAAFSALFSAVLISVMALTVLAQVQQPEEQPPFEAPGIIPDPDQQNPSDEPPQSESQDPSIGDEQFGTKLPSEGEIDPGMGGNGNNSDSLPVPPDELDKTQPDDPSMQGHSSDQLM